MCSQWEALPGKVLVLVIEGLLQLLLAKPAKAKPASGTCDVGDCTPSACNHTVKDNHDGKTSHANRVPLRLVQIYTCPRLGFRADGGGMPVALHPGKPCKAM